MSFNFFEHPFPFPCGEAIRRHVARGWITLRLKPPFRMSVGRYVSVKVKPFGHALRDLDPDST